MKKLLLSIFAIAAITALFLFTGCGKGGSTPEPTPPVVVAKITSLSPTSGTPGTSVTVTGTGFNTAMASNKVLFNGKDATVTAASATELTVTVPADAGTGAVTVSVNGAAVVTGPVFTYVEPAKITSVDKTEGAAYAIVAITGTGFGAAITDNHVYFNGKEATVSAATITKLTVAVPVAAGTGIITLSVNGAPAVTGPSFTYVQSYVSTVFVGDGGGQSGLVNSIGTSARFSGIEDIAFDAGDNLLIVDNGNHMIRKATPSAAVTSLIGTFDFYGPAFNGTISTTALNYPISIASDATGSFYVGESFEVVHKVTSAGAASIIVLPALGVPVLTASPTSMCADASGNIFIADYSTNHILKISPSGVVSNFAGSATGVPGYADGTGADALFNSPRSITIDKTGNLYVIDNVKQKIRKITPAGVVTTYSDVATLNENSLAIDAAGNLYVGNAYYLGNAAVVKISPDGQKKMLTIYYASDITGIAVNKNNEVFYSAGATVYKLALQ